MGRMDNTSDDEKIAQRAEERNEAMEKTGQVAGTEAIKTRKVKAVTAPMAPIDGREL
jgi:hypothetical protein